MKYQKVEKKLKPIACSGRRMFQRLQGPLNRGPRIRVGLDCESRRDPGNHMAGRGLPSSEHLPTILRLQSLPRASDSKNKALC